MHPLACSFAQLRLVSLSPLWAWLYPEGTQQADGAWGGGLGGQLQGDGQ